MEAHPSVKIIQKKGAGIKAESEKKPTRSRHKVEKDVSGPILWKRNPKPSGVLSR